MENIDLGFRVVGFRRMTKFKADGSVRNYDLVSICPKGEADRSVTEHFIEELQRARDVAPGSNDIAAQIAQLRWKAIKPHYDAWLHGHEIPEDGIPLGAWPHLTPEQAEVLRKAGHLTVEAVATLTENERNRVPLPGIAKLQEMAVAFLAAQDKGAAAAKLAAVEGENASLRSEVDELKAMLQEAMEALPKRRGRPPKSDAPEGDDVPDEVAA